MSLQSLINSQPPKSRLELLPGEFFGQVTIYRPITIVGSGKGTWIGARTSPTIKITTPGVKLENLMVEIISDTEAIAIEAAPGTDSVLQDVTLRGDTVGIAAENIHSTETPSEKKGADISFLPPPPMSGGFSGQQTQVPTSATRSVSPSGSPIDQRLDSLFEKADQAENSGDWPTAAKAYEDILILAPRRADVKRLLKLARRNSKILRTTSQTKPPGVAVPSGKPGAPSIWETTTLTAKDRVVSLMRQSKKFFVVVAVVIGAVLVVFAARSGMNVLERSLETSVEKRQTASLPSVSDKKRTFSNEIMELLRRAEQGDAEAQYKLGGIFRYGIGVPEDDVEAVKWYRRLADQGDARGPFSLGLMYEDGDGVGKNLYQAKKWYRKAARQGHPAARYRLRQLEQ